MYYKKRNPTLQASESQEEAVDTILTVTDRLFSSVGDAHEMVKQARQLAQVNGGLVLHSHNTKKFRELLFHPDWYIYRNTILKLWQKNKHFW